MDLNNPYVGRNVSLPPFLYKLIMRGILVAFICMALWLAALSTGIHVKWKFKVVETEQKDNYIDVKIKSYQNKKEGKYIFLVTDFFDENDVLIHTRLMQVGSFMFDKGFYEVSVPIPEEKFATYKSYIKHIKESEAIEANGGNTKLTLYSSIITGIAGMKIPTYYSDDGLRMKVDKKYFDDRYVEYKPSRRNPFRRSLFK